MQKNIGISEKLKACIEGYQETEEAIESLSQELPANVLK